VGEFGVRQASQPRLEFLASLLGELRERLQVDRLHLLEVGSYEGESALAWARAIASCCLAGGSVTCVDPWEPYLGGESGEHYRKMDEDLASGEVFKRFLRNIQAAPPTVEIVAWRGSLRAALEAARLLERFSVVYLDGSHSFDRVREDIALAKGLVRVGGMLCGDDLERKLESELEAEQVRQVPQRDYVGGFHPGVSLAVWEAFGARVRTQGGAWALRKTGEGWEPWLRS
jgi:hypothetical protein